MTTLRIGEIDFALLSRINVFMRLSVLNRPLSASRVGSSLLWGFFLDWTDFCLFILGV